jgi:hypothetical protein
VARLFTAQPESRQADLVDTHLAPMIPSGPIRAIVEIRTKKRATQRVALNGQQLSVIYGTSWLIRVAQFARLLRVPPQVKPPPETRYCESVQLCPMYSLAIHKDEPSLTAPP